MASSSPGRVVAACFGLSGFAVAVLSGLSAGNAPADVLWRALVSMAILGSMGVVAGAIVERTIAERVMPRRGAAPEGATGAAPSTGYAPQEPEAGDAA